jgi:CIC family chloride channel protein
MDVLLAVVIGALSGLGAAGFYWFLHLCTRFLLTDLAGYTPATLASEPGGMQAATAFGRPWLIPIVVAAGAFVATVLVRWLAPEAEGHGTDAAIRAIHHDPSGTPAATGLVKLVAAGLTIGSGGSGGSEGPAAQITAAGASLITRVFRIPFERARVAVMVGLGSGVGAIFRSPLGGGLLAAEIGYRSDIEAAAIIPGIAASCVAFGVFGLFHGFTPIFGTVTEVNWSGPSLALYPVLGLLVGLVGRLYIWTYYFASAQFARPVRWLPRLVRPALAGAVVGLLGLLIPGVLGTGYGTAQAALDAAKLTAVPLLLLLLIPLAKIVATSLSIGSGGSGGIFGPGLVIGATTGAALWRLLEPTGIVPSSPAPFVIAGMAACVGAAVRAPLALIAMSVEATRDVGMLVPTMAATVVACLVMGNATLFRSQLPSRLEAPSDPVGPHLDGGGRLRWAWAGRSGTRKPPFRRDDVPPTPVSPYPAGTSPAATSEPSPASSSSASSSNASSSNASSSSAPDPTSPSPASANDPG